MNTIFRNVTALLIGIGILFAIGLALDVWDKAERSSYRESSSVEVSEDVLPDLYLNDEEVAEIKESMQDLEERELKGYEKWKLSEELVASNRHAFGASPTDCISVEGDTMYTAGGDLLSTMIVDEGAREIMDLELYSVEYLKTLEQRIAKETQQRYGSDFFAAKACHLQEGLDYAVGYLWATGMSVPDEASYKDEYSPNWEDAETVLIIATDERILSTPMIQIAPGQAVGTPGEPCSAELSDEALVWKCHGRTLFDPALGHSSAFNNLWKFPLDGSLPKRWREVTEFKDDGSRVSVPVLDSAIYDSWQTYTAPDGGFSFRHPPESTIEQDEDNPIRLQNYSYDDDRFGLVYGEYYMEIWKDDHTSCEDQVSFPFQQDFGLASGLRGFGDWGGDAGGIRFAFCYRHKEETVWGHVTEADRQGEVAAGIIESFKAL